MENVIVILILVAIAAGGIWHLVRTRKQGGCVGCPHAKNCTNCSCNKPK